ncbi:hypothetical protein ACFLRA_03905 [Bdellovibrionota bacterium]
MVTNLLKKAIPIIIVFFAQNAICEIPKSPITITKGETKEFTILNVTNVLVIDSAIATAQKSKNKISFTGVAFGKTTVLLTIGTQITPLLLVVERAVEDRRVEFVSGFRPYLHPLRPGRHSVSIQNNSKYTGHDFYQNPAFTQATKIFTPIGKEFQLLGSSTFNFDEETLEWNTGFLTLQTEKTSITGLDFSRRFGQHPILVPSGASLRGGDFLTTQDLRSLKKLPNSEWFLSLSFGINQPNIGVFWNTYEDTLVGGGLGYSNIWGNIWSNLFGFKKENQNRIKLFQSHGGQIGDERETYARGQFWLTDSGKYWDAEAQYRIERGEENPREILNIFSQYASLGAGYNFWQTEQQPPIQNRFALTVNVDPLDYLGFNLGYFNQFTDSSNVLPTAEKSLSNSISAGVTLARLGGFNVSLSGAAGVSEGIDQLRVITSKSISYATGLQVSPLKKNTLIPRWNHNWSISIDKLTNDRTHNLEENLNNSFSFFKAITVGTYGRYNLSIENQPDQDSFLHTLSGTINPSWAYIPWRLDYSYTLVKSFDNKDTIYPYNHSMQLNASYREKPHAMTASLSALIISTPDEPTQLSGTINLGYTRTFDNENIKDLFLLPRTGQISAQVFFDENQNGKKDPKDRSVTGVIIRTGEHVATTNSQGLATLENLDPGNYHATVDPSSLPEGAFITTPTTVDVSVYRNETSEAVFGISIYSSITCNVFEDVNENKKLDPPNDILVQTGICTIKNPATQDMYNIYSGTTLVDLPPGKYEVYLDPLQLPPGHLPISQEPELILIRPQTEKTLRLLTDVHRTIKGILFIDSNQNQTYEEEFDEPVPGLKFKLGSKTLQTNENGQYILRDVKMAKYDIKLEERAQLKYRLLIDQLTVDLNDIILETDLPLVKLD